MVRIQKILYERVVNSKALGRNRVISTPYKWYPTNFWAQSKYLTVKYWNTIIGRISYPLAFAFFKTQARYTRDILLQMGLRPQQFILHHPTEIRRQIMFNHISRQNLHPYHVILKNIARRRYQKIQITLPGTFAPDFIRQEAQTQAIAEVEALRSQWQEFIFSNYYADKTPTAHRTLIGSAVAFFDAFVNHGLMTPAAWQRYFMNESSKMWLPKQLVDEVNEGKKFPFDLTTAEGKRKFEKFIKEVNQKVPGYVVPEGQKFDFQAHYKKLGV